MAAVELSIRTRSDATTDIGVIWKAAIVRYEEITKTKIESVAMANDMDGILNEIREKEEMFKSYRHNNSKLAKFRSLVIKTLDPIEKLSSLVAAATLSVRQNSPSY